MNQSGERPELKKFLTFSLNLRGIAPPLNKSLSEILKALVIHDLACDLTAQQPQIRFVLLMIVKADHHVDVIADDGVAVNFHAEFAGDALDHPGDVRQIAGGTKGVGSLGPRRADDDMNAMFCAQRSSPPAPAMQKGSAEFFGLRLKE